jgi:hypothetical protein
VGVCGAHEVGPSGSPIAPTGSPILPLQGNTSREDKSGRAAEAAKRSDLNQVGGDFARHEGYQLLRKSRDVAYPHDGQDSRLCGERSTVR